MNKSHAANIQLFYNKTSYGLIILKLLQWAWCRKKRGKTEISKDDFWASIMMLTLPRIPFYIKPWVDKCGMFTTCSSLETALVLNSCSPSFISESCVLFSWNDLISICFSPSLLLRFCLPLHSISHFPSRYTLSGPVGNVLVWAVTIILPWAMQCHFECLNATVTCIISLSFFCSSGLVCGIWD